MGKVCVITGASQGIGRAAAVRMSREPDVDAARPDRPQRERASRRRPRRWTAEGKRGRGHPLRPGRPRRHPGARRAHLRPSYGSIDILLNIAGYADPQSLLDTTTENIVTTYTINVFAMLVLIREAVRHIARPARRRSSTWRRPPGSPRGRAGWRTPRRRRPSCRCRRRSPTSWPAAASRSTASRPGRTATELRRKLAPEEDPTTIMQPSQVADVIAQLMSDDEADARRPEHRRPHAGLTGG